MDKRIREWFHDGILAEAALRFEAGTVDLVGGFESFVYEYGADGARYILRLSHSSRRTADQIRGEVEWINYLVDGGVPAAPAIPSQQGNLVEVIDATEGYFSAVSFVKAAGTFVRSEQWQPSLFERLGWMVGRMHALTKPYMPGHPRYKRREWYEESQGFAERCLPPTEQVAINRFNDLIAYLHTLPRDGDSYGLVHTDVHRGNFYVAEDGTVTLFDFDDCQYSWFVDDIAMALFYAVPHRCEGEANLALARTFFRHFMRGYRCENQLAPAWFRQIPAFLKARELGVYAAIHAAFDDLDALDPWCASFMDGRRQRIADDVPYVDLDFEALARDVAKRAILIRPFLWGMPGGSERAPGA